MKPAGCDVDEEDVRRREGRDTEDERHRKNHATQLRKN
jgi:hypothetical protein